MTNESGPMSGKPASRPLVKVLLVDDDEDIRRDYARVLRRANLNVSIAANGADALFQLELERFDVILSDISMPTMSGIELLKAVREQHLDLPVLLMTGSPTLDTAIRAVDYGATRYLPKPIEGSALVEAVWRAADLHRLALLRREVGALADTNSLQLGDRAALETHFSRAIERIWAAFQPIVSCSNRTVVAYEALMRSNEPSLARPHDLLDAAERLHRLHDLGRVMRACVAAAAVNAPPGLLFVNLHPLELNDNQLLASDTPLSEIANRVVLEITERAALDDVSGLSMKLSKLRSLGFRIAVDDLGAGYAGLTSFSRLEPEFVKLDLSLIRNVDRSARKRTLLRGIARICSRDLGMQVICEGVETEQERDALIEDGLDWMQGFLFGEPREGFLPPFFSDP